MSRVDRLTSSRDFERVFKTGKRGASGAVLCIATTSDPSTHVRVGVSVRLPGAVRRNRAKRLLREAARSLRSQLRPGTDLIFVGRPGITGSSFHDIVVDATKAAQRAGAAW